MKLFLLPVLLFALFGIPLSARDITDTVPAGNNYLERSRKQKTDAWSLAGTGTALLITAMVIPRGDEQGYSALSLYTQKEYENDGLKAVISLAGIACLGVSIPLFIASGKNRRRAENISLHIRNSARGIPMVNGYSPSRHPELMVRLKF